MGNLRYVSLIDIELRNSYWRSADLTRGNLTDADLTGATMLNGEPWPEEGMDVRQFTDPE